MTMKCSLESFTPSKTEASILTCTVLTMGTHRVHGSSCNNYILAVLAKVLAKFLIDSLYVMSAEYVTIFLLGSSPSTVVVNIGLGVECVELTEADPFLNSLTKRSVTNLLLFNCIYSIIV